MSGSTTAIYSKSITRLNGTNYFSWAFDMKMALISQGYWSIVDPAKEAEQKTLSSTQQETAEKALAHIVMAVEPAQKQHLQACSTGREAWKKFSDIYGAPDAASRMVKLDEFRAMRQNTDERVYSWCSRVEAESLQMIGMGIRLDNKDKITVLLKGVTPAYFVSRSVLYA